MENELERFQGNWIQVAYERDGQKEPIDDEQGWKPRTEFKGKAFAVTISDGTIPIRGVFAIDPGKEPKQISYTDTFGQYAGETYLGIYDFAEELLVFCMADHLAERPMAFSTGPGQVMRTFQREDSELGSE